MATRRHQTHLREVDPNDVDANNHALIRDGVALSLRGGSGIAVSVQTPSHPDVTIALASTWKAGIAGVCNNSLWTPSELTVTLPCNVSTNPVPLASGTTIQLGTSGSSIVFEAGHPVSVGYQWIVLNAHATASVTIGKGSGVSLYGATVIAAKECAFVRQYSESGFLVLSVPTNAVGRVFNNLLSTNNNVSTTTSLGSGTVLLTHNAGTTIIIDTPLGVVQLRPNTNTIGWYWYVVNATNATVPVAATVNATTGMTATVSGGSSIVAGRAVLIRQISETEFVFVGYVPDANVESIQSTVFNSTVGLSAVDTQLPDDANHPNGSTVLMNGSVGSALRIVSSGGLATGRSWYVVNNTGGEVAIVPMVGGAAAPSLHGAQYIPVGRVIRLRQYAPNGYHAFVSHPNDTAPNVVLSAASTFFLPSALSSDPPLRNGSTVDLTGNSLVLYGDSRTVGYVWFLNNNSTSRLTIQPSTRAPQGAPTVTGSTVLQRGEVAIVRQVEDGRYIVNTCAAGNRPVHNITINNATITGQNANTFCLLQLGGSAPFGIIVSNQTMSDGAEVDFFNNTGADIAITATISIASRGSLRSIPDRGSAQLKYNATTPEFILVGALV